MNLRGRSKRAFGAVVEFGQPVPVVFDYLGDPRNRPEWQSSLLSVTLKERTAPHVGMRWTETTVIGVRPRMEITTLDPLTTWSERGSWHGVVADLTLRFADTPGGCRVKAEGVIRGGGAWRVPVVASGVVASRAIGADLRRATRILADRGPR